MSDNYEWKLVSKMETGFQNVNSLQIETNVSEIGFQRTLSKCTLNLIPSQRRLMTNNDVTKDNTTNEDCIDLLFCESKIFKNRE